MTAVSPKELIVPVQSFGRWLVLVVASVAAIVGVARLWMLGDRVAGVDFYQFWLVGTELRYGNASEIYSNQMRTVLAKTWLDKARETGSWREYHAAKRRQQLETYSTPFLYTVFAALSTGNYEADYHRYRLLCLAVFVTSIIGLCRVYQYSWRASLLMLALFTGCSWPAWLDVACAQVNLLQLGGLALYVGLQGLARWRFRHVACGGLLGLLLAFKPNLVFAVALVFVSWVVNGNWRKLVEQAVGLLVAVILAVAVSSWVFGSIHCWSDWASTLHVLMKSTAWRNIVGNCSLSALLEQTLGGHFQTPVLVVSSLVAAGVMVVTRRQIVWNRPQTDAAGNRLGSLQGDSHNQPTAPDSCETERGMADRDLLVMGLGVTIMLLSSNLVWLHYFLLLVPLSIYCLRPHNVDSAVRGRWREQVVAAGACLLMALVPLRLILPFRTPQPGLSDVLHRWLVNAFTEDLVPPFVDTSLSTALCSLGTLILFVLALRELVQGPVPVDSRATLFQPLDQTPAPIVVPVDSVTPVDSVAVGALMSLEMRQEA